MTGSKGSPLGGSRAEPWSGQGGEAPYLYLLASAFQHRGWLAESVGVDSFVTTRRYAGRLFGNQALDQIYRLLCPAIVTQAPETAAELETSLLSVAHPSHVPPHVPSPWVAEAWLAETLPGLLPHGPCPMLEALRRTPPMPEDFFTTLGYQALGPILALFARWVVTRFPTGPLVALLRDGRLLGQAVALMCPDAAGRLREAWLSREVCLTAAIRSAEDRDRLFTLLIRARGVPVTVGGALTALGLTAEQGGCPLAIDDPLDPARFERLYEWLNTRAAVRAELQRHCRALLRTVIEHLAAVNLLDVKGALDAGGIGLIDVGYAGNVQRTLAMILAAEGYGIPLRGAYLLTSEGAVWTAAAAGPVEGFLAAYGAPSWLAALWLRTRELFELLLAQPDGALTEYRDGVPHCGRSPLPPGQLAEIARIQAGALAFVRAWRGHGAGGPEDNHRDHRDHRDHLRLIAARLLLLPSSQEVRGLENWLCDDAMAIGTPRPLIEPVPTAGAAFRAPRAALLWPAGSAVAHADATPSELLAAWLIRMLNNNLP